MPDEPPPDDEFELLARVVQQLEQGGKEAVESMLAENPQQASVIREKLKLLEQFGMLAPPRTTAGTMPERLDEFVLRERLGSGGMGVVYLAEQPSLRREVALKLIRPDSLHFPKARERFRREVEAIAGLQHPAIVRVFSANVEGDLPYFTMERVEGVSLDQLLAKLHGLTAGKLTEADVRDALIELGGGKHVAALAARPRGWVELSCQWTFELADAIDYAHRHGVLHRDIKPSNVMITWSMRAMLLDFGLASTQDHGKLTRTGALLGSLPYMAPEQIRGEADRIGPRTDIYALGVLLYELLTLTNPFHEGSSSADETRQRVIAAAAPPVRRSNPSVSWDAETVCQCAMAPEPERRYPTAQSLAEDLQNLLSLRPIAARRPGAILRARRWVDRHRALAATAAMAVLLAIATPAAFAISEHQLRKQITTAMERAESEAKTLADVLDFFTDELLLSVSPDEVGKDATMRQVLDLASTKIEGRFADRPLVEAEIRSTIGHTYRKLGVLETAQVHLQRATELFAAGLGPTDRKTLDAQRRLASVYSAQGLYQKQAELLRKNLHATREAFGDEDPGTLTSANNLGLALTRIDQHIEAIEILRDVVDKRLRLLGENNSDTQTSMSNLGLVYYLLGHYTEAEKLWRKELELCRRLHGDDSGSTMISRHNLANLLAMQELYAEGLEQMEQVISAQLRIYGPHHIETLSSMSGQANMLAACGRREEALTVFDEIERQATELPEDSRLILHVRNARCEVLRQMGRLADARRLNEQLVAYCLRSQGEHAEPTIRAKASLARLCIAEGDREQAASCLGEALAAWQSQPTGWLAQLRLDQGQNLRELQRYPEAERELLQARSILDQPGGGNPVSGKILDELVLLYEQWGRADELASWRTRRDQWRQRQ